MKSNETASVKMVIDLSDYQNVDNVVTAIKNPQEEQLKRVQPKTKKELKSLIDKTIKEQGTACDLNFIDTSLIKDMGELFSYSKFNGDISSWDVSNVTDMSFMFYDCPFNGNISSWNYRNDVNRENMFKK
jgi:surface protein